MIWLDALALTTALVVLFASKTFFGKVLSVTLLTHYIAATLSEFGGGDMQTIIRLFCFLIVFLGSGLVMVLMFSQSNRKKRDIEL